MATVAIHELHEQTDDVLRRVREHGEPVDVVDGNQIVAILVPVLPMTDELRARTLAALDALDVVAEQIGDEWTDGMSAADAVRDVRREL